MICHHIEIGDAMSPGIVRTWGSCSAGERAMTVMDTSTYHTHSLFSTERVLTITRRRRADILGITHITLTKALT